MAMMSSAVCYDNKFFCIDFMLGFTTDIAQNKSTNNKEKP